MGLVGFRKRLTKRNEMVLVLASVAAVVLVIEVVVSLHGGRQCWHCAGPKSDSSIWPVTLVSEQNGPEATSASIGGIWQEYGQL